MPGGPGAKNPEQQFSEIYARCRQRGITPHQLSRLAAVKKLRSVSPGGAQVRFPSHRVVCGVVVVLVSVCLYCGGVLPARAWFYFRGLDPGDEMCLVDMPPEVQNLFMPPVDCSMCRNLSRVERVADISPEEFEERFAYTAVPVVVVDGTKGWSALESFSIDFFKGLYLAGDQEGRQRMFRNDDVRECQFFPYRTEFRSLSEALRMSPDRAGMQDGSAPWYIGWSNCDAKIGSILRKHYRRPYFLPLQSESTNIDWIFMGTPGYGAHMHIDHVNNPSWQAQIRGSKLWTLEPVPECYGECGPVEVLVRTGEVVVLDTNRWYHKTLIVGKDLSITIGSEFD